MTAGMMLIVISRRVAASKIDLMIPPSTRNAASEIAEACSDMRCQSMSSRIRLKRYSSI